MTEKSTERSGNINKVNNEESVHVPQLRFPGFNDEWEEILIGEKFNFFSTNSLSRAKLNEQKGIVKNIHYGDIHTKFPSIVNVQKEEIPYISEEVEDNKLDKMEACKNGDLLIADASEDYEDIGKTIEIQGIKDERIVGGLHTLMLRDKTNNASPLFNGYLFQNEKLKKEIKIRANGISVLGISKKELEKITIKIPQKEEQKQISDLLFSIDQKISFMEKNYNKLSKLKKYYQQIIFNNLDNTYPIKLEKIINKFSTGLNPRNNFKLNDGGNNFYVTIKNFHGGNLYLDDSCDRINDKALKIINKRSKLEKGDILFSSIGRIGDSYLVKEKPMNWDINESVFALKANTNYVTKEYLYCLLNSDRVQYSFKMNTTGSTLKSIKMKDLKKIKVNIHSNLNHQKNISSLLIEIDNKLNLYNKTINFNKHFKCSLLSKMFC